MISKLSAQRNLLIVWVSGTVIFVIITIFQQAGGFFDANINEVWDWFLPNFFPTLTMILGAYISLAIQDNVNDNKIRRSDYRLCLSFIIIYFLFFLIILILSNTDSNSKIPIMEYLKSHSKLTGTVHGAVTLLLGLIFTKEKSKT